MQAQNIESYAGTSQRYSQRLICSEAAIRQWDIATTDISKAFLQGITYEELAKLTGEPLREVNFYLPAYNISMLRTIKGFETFDPNTEVLHCLKPGTGCTDAPRCFSMKLATVTQGKCNMQPCSVDGELCYLHDSKGDLLAMMAKHVDDLKMAGSRENIIWILQQIEQVFGKLKIEWNNFKNCGIAHKQDVTDKSVTLDQNDYVQGIKLVEPSDLTGNDPETECSPEVHAQYWSCLLYTSPSPRD